MPSERVKTRSRVLRGPGLYITQHRVGNSAFLARCGDSTEGLYEVGVQENIAYGVGARFNECRHSVMRSDNSYLPAEAGELTSIQWRGECRVGGDITNLEPVESEFVCLEPSGSTELAVSLAQIENARLDGYNRLTHLNPPRHMNALQAAMELKDTKQTMGQALAFMGWVRSHLGQTVKVAKGTLRPLSAATKLATCASAYLWYKFGVEPTATDVKRFIQEVSSGKLRVRGIKPRLLKKGEVIRGYYSARPSTENILSAMYPNAPSGHIHQSIRRNVDYYGNVFRLDIRPSGQTDWFSCRRVVSHDEIKGCWFAKLRHDLEISGIEEWRNRFSWNCPSFRTLWELVPFSFLIDWVVDVGKFIERMEKRYATQNYRPHFESIWLGERRSSVTYAPSLRSLSMRLENPVTVSPVKWTVNQSVTGSLAFYRCAQTSSYFRRMYTSQPNIAVPEWAQHIKAYQITTGMALLLQAAKAWR